MYQVAQSIILVVIALAMTAFIISGAITLNLSHASPAHTSKRVSVKTMSKVTIACSTTAFAAALTGAIVEHLAH